MKIEVNENIESNLVAANKRLEILNETLKDIINLNNRINEKDWTGEAKERFLVFIEIVSKFHKELKNVTETQVKTYELLIKFSEEFINENANLKEIRGID